MFSMCADALGCAFCYAKKKGEESVEYAGDKVKAAKGAASEYTFAQLRQSLEGAKEHVHKAPDVYVTILQVNMQEGVEVRDLLNFRLSGLKCRVRLEVTGTAAQLAGMVAAGAAKKVGKVAGKAEAAVAGALGFSALGVGDAVASGAGGIRDALAGKASEGTETKSVEFDMNLDLGVRKGGEEVSAVVSIAGDAFDRINQVVPVSAATKYVEEAITERVKEMIRDYAKRTAIAKAKGVVGDKAVDAGLSGAAKVGEVYGKAKEKLAAATAPKAGEPEDGS